MMVDLLFASLELGVIVFFFLFIGIMISLVLLHIVFLIWFWADDKISEHRRSK